MDTQSSRYENKQLIIITKNKTCVLPHAALVAGMIGEAAKAFPPVPAPLTLVHPGVRVDHSAVTMPR